MSTSGPTVWIYTDVHPPAVAGAAYMVETWTNQLTAQGYDVRVFFPSGSLKKWRTPKQVAFTTWKNVAYHGDLHARFSTFRELRRARKEKRPDLILVATPARVGMLGLATAAALDVPMVIVHSADLVSAMEFHSSVRPILTMAPKITAMAMVSPKVRRAMVDLGALRAQTGSLSDRMPIHLLRAAQQNASAVIVLTHKRVEMFRGWTPNIPVEIIPSGIDRLPDVPAPAKLTWNEGALRLIYVGRFAREKNIIPAVEALKVAADAGVNVHLNMVGEGDMAGPLAELAAKLGVSDRLTIQGPFPRPTLRNIYAGAEVFVFPSLFDTQGFVLNEAAHEGLAILLSDAKVNPVVKAGESALVVEPTAQGYADGYAKLADPQYRSQIGSAAAALAQSLTEESQSLKLGEVLRRAMAG